MTTDFPTKTTIVVFGHAERDHNELVCQFFENLYQAMDFVRDLPGTYQWMSLEGIAYEDFEVFTGPQDMPVGASIPINLDTLEH